jgi:hypothetical protein
MFVRFYRELLQSRTRAPEKSIRAVSFAPISIV